MADFYKNADEGFHFSLPGYPDMIVCIIDVNVLGQEWVLGVGDGTTGYTVVEKWWGPAAWDSSQPCGVAVAAQIPGANAAIHKFLQTAKQYPPVQGSDSATEANVNRTLGQYFAFDPMTQTIVQVPFP